MLIHVNYSAHTREFTYMLMNRDSWKVVGTVLIHVNYSAHTHESHSCTRESIHVQRTGWLGAEPRKIRKTSNFNKGGEE